MIDAEVHLVGDLELDLVVSDRDGVAAVAVEGALADRVAGHDPRGRLTLHVLLVEDRVVQRLLALASLQAVDRFGEERAERLARLSDSR